MKVSASKLWNESNNTKIEFGFLKFTYLAVPDNVRLSWKKMNYSNKV